MKTGCWEWRTWPGAVPGGELSQPIPASHALVMGAFCLLEVPDDESEGQAGRYDR